MKKINRKPVIHIHIDYDSYLKKESKLIAKTIEKTFGYKTTIKKQEHPEWLIYQENLGAYKGSFNKAKSNTMYLTGNHILKVNAKSPEDYLLGESDFRRRSCIISTARMFGKHGEESAILQVSQKEYKRRLISVAIHEIGHWAVQDQTHMDQYITSVFDESLHCPDPLCIMWGGGLLIQKEVYPGYFCTQCNKSLLPT